ncbi:MAG: beta-ketoacyl synthase N-terminal-like domain-containing protein, partial [Pseudomonadota bacterium]
MTTADRKSLQLLVTGALADLLGLSQAQIDPDERFSHYGLSSLSAAALIASLSALLGRALPPTLVWDYPSSSRLAAFLSGETSDVRMKAVSPMADDEPVAIIGLACRLPGAADPEAFWQLLIGGVEAVGEMPRKRFDVEALIDPDASVPGRMSTRRGGFLEQVDLFDAG